MTKLLLKIFPNVLMLYTVSGFYAGAISTQRFTIDSTFLRIGVDFLIYLILLYRTLDLIYWGKRTYTEKGAIDNAELSFFGAYCVLIALDLSDFYNWIYFVPFMQTYSLLSFIYSLPALVWVFELIKRSSFKTHQWSYFLLVLLFVGSIVVGYSLTLHVQTAYMF